MRRLYLRIYFAVLASLAVFALAAAALWHAVAEPREGGAVAVIARNVLAPATAPAAEQQAALERLARDVPVDLALFEADRSSLPRWARPCPFPGGAGWQARRPPGASQLADGRWITVRSPHPRRGPAFGVLFLALILVGVGVGAYPVVRRLTQAPRAAAGGVESLGAGELSARVKVEGRDEVAQLAESFNRAAARIEELVAAHKTLLANASHELRTPLARIRMALELGKDKREVEQDIAELDALIDEMLLASRLDAVATLENVEEVDLLALAAEEAARYDVEARGRADDDARRPAAPAPDDPQSPRERARHGAPPIDVSVRNRELRVCDGGPGVPPADRERIFEPFNSKRGTGLGLALVRQIARRHGGEARCEGSCFYVTLPAG